MGEFVAVQFTADRQGLEALVADEAAIRESYTELGVTWSDLIGAVRTALATPAHTLRAQLDAANTPVVLTAYLLRAFDAVSISNIPRTARYVFYYENGTFADYAAVRAQCPDAQLFSIGVFPGPNAWMIDCELGDFTVAQAETQIEAELAAGQYRPCVYANLDRWENQGLLSGVAKYGARVRRAVAEFDNIPEIPAGYDAKQYATGNVDTWVCLPDFFDGRPAPPAPKPRGTVRFVGSIDLETGKKTVHGLPGVGVHFAGPAKQVKAEVAIEVGAEHGGEWTIT